MTQKVFVRHIFTGKIIEALLRESNYKTNLFDILFFKLINHCLLNILDFSFNMFDRRKVNIMLLTSIPPLQKFWLSKLLVWNELQPEYSLLGAMSAGHINTHVGWSYSLVWRSHHNSLIEGCIYEDQHGTKWTSISSFICIWKDQTSTIRCDTYLLTSKHDFQRSKRIQKTIWWMDNLF